jgi:uncharacterized protein with WD repeat
MACRWLCACEYRAQEAHLRWSPNGAAVLVHTHTDVDTSGVSYYGSTGRESSTFEASS